MEVIHFDEIESTQKYVKMLLKEGKRDFVVVADMQSDGTGRYGRNWGAPKGGLWFSFVCTKPVTLPDDLVSFFTLAVGVVVKNLLEKFYACELQIKWPNDILLDGKKVCGILCEKIEENLVCGIGLNTNVLAEELKVYNAMATSLFEETGKKVDNRELMIQIIEGCISKLNNLLTEGEYIVKEINSVLAYKGEKRYLTYLDKEAEIVEVDGSGRLIVLEDGVQKFVFAGEVV